MARFTDKLSSSNPHLVARSERIQEWTRDFSIENLAHVEAYNLFKGMIQVWRLPIDPKDKADRVRRIAAAWESLRSRSASKPGDKIINFTVACIMNSDDSKHTRELLDVSVGERMTYWVTRQPAIPLGFLFTAGPKVREDGLRWLPSGIHHGALHDEECIPRSPSDRRLVFRRPGYILEPTTSILRPVFQIVQTGTGQSYTLEFDEHGPPEWLEHPASLGLILQTAVSATNSSVGVLILIESQSATKVEGAHQCRVDVRPSEMNSSERDLVQVNITKLPEDTLWCVG